MYANSTPDTAIGRLIISVGERIRNYELDNRTPNKKALEDEYQQWKDSYPESEWENNKKALDMKRKQTAKKTISVVLETKGLQRFFQLFLFCSFRSVI